MELVRVVYPVGEAGPVLAAVVALIVVAFIAVRAVYFGGGSAYIAPERELTQVSLEQAAPSEWKAVEVENPTESRGVAVVDFAHDNGLKILSLEERSENLEKLFSRLTTRK